VSSKLCALSCIAVLGLMLCIGCGGQSPIPAADDTAGLVDPASPEARAADAVALKAAPEWQLPLTPAFQEAAAAYEVPLDLLLTLGKIGSGLENRGQDATIEGGYGVMALRDNELGGKSLELAAQLTGVSAEQLVTNPVANINGAAAVLNAYAIEAGVDRAGGIEAWLPAVVKYAGLDDEDSKFFAMGVYEQIQLGWALTNGFGEDFAVASQPMQTINLDSLVPPGMKKIPLEALEAGIDPDTLGPVMKDKDNRLNVDYPGATWDPAASCNYTATSSSKDTIIIHTAEGSAAGTRSWFKNCAAQVSSQYVVSEAGGVWQCVVESYKAWHVGCLNTRSVGIEHEGYASSSSHPAALYNASALLCRNICDRRGIAKAHHTCPPGILGHLDANNCSCGGTHTDPGNGWDWGYFINAIIGTPPPPTWAATYRAQSFPATMVAGSTAIVWAEFNNTGTGHWMHDQTKLGTQGPQDRSSPFCNLPNWLACNRPSDVDQSDVANGQVGRFTFILKAPTTPGTYTEQYKPVREGVTWFGPVITWTITVTPSGPDTTPPSVPGTPTATAASTSQINLSWTGSTDNIGVTEYRIYRNGAYLDSVGGTTLSYNNTGLAMGTTYSYTVSAKDAAGNESAQSGARDETTWIILDNASAGFTASANWATSTSSEDKYAADYRWRSTAALSDQAVWAFNIPTADTYQVYVWWAEGANRSAAAPYSVNGSAGIPMNQQTNGGQWNSIGTFSMAAGSNNVKLSCWAATGFVVVGDAIRVVRR
jgi:N-acetyl-anhydromuramyl-L-alanine amidase AmpD